jgi:hypothetical protein
MQSSAKPKFDITMPKIPLMLPQLIGDEDSKTSNCDEIIFLF